MAAWKQDLQSTNRFGVSVEVILLLDRPVSGLNTLVILLCLFVLLSFLLAKQELTAKKLVEVSW